MDFTKNPMMLYFLMSQKGDKNDMLPYLMATTCGYEGLFQENNYCSNCGVKFDGGQDK